LKRIVIICSSGGIGVEVMADAVKRGVLEMDIALVVCNIKDAGALGAAEKWGIPTKLVPHKGLSRDEHDEQMAAAIMEAKPDLVVMMAYLRILGPRFFDIIKCPVMNVHPALLPAFGGKGMYGRRVYEEVLVSGCKITGPTIHFVTPEVDAGPIIVQRCVAVDDCDTVDSLAMKVIPHEMAGYVHAVGLFLDDRLKVEGRRVRILGE